MPNASFEITSSVEFFHILQGMTEDLKNDPTSSRKAVAAFMFAYHLREWVWKEHETLVREKLECDNWLSFCTYVNSQHKNFSLIRDICNGSKHFSPTDNSRLSSSGLTGGGFSSGFSSGFNIGHLTVTAGTNKISATQLLSDAITYYDHLLRKLGAINADDDTS